MSKNAIVVDKLLELKEEEHNYLYIHGNSETEELTFVVKGDTDLLSSALLQAMKEDNNLLDLLRTAVFLYEFDQRQHNLN
jgi:hypothetical protein